MIKKLYEKLINKIAKDVKNAIYEEVKADFGKMGYKK